MTKKRNIIKLLIIPVLLLVFASCEYNQLDEPVAAESASFATDIIPMFNQSCNMSGCHPAGGIPPDLSVENAYLALTLSGMVDTLDPESSLLYVRMIDTRKPMPPAGLLSDYEISLVLAWIKGGAKND